MKKQYKKYILKECYHGRILNSFNTAREAISASKTYASYYYRSVNIYREYIYYGTAEYPIYLRHIGLNPEEIHFYKAR